MGNCSIQTLQSDVHSSKRCWTMEYHRTTAHYKNKVKFQFPTRSSALSVLLTPLFSGESDSKCLMALLQKKFQIRLTKKSCKASQHVYDLAPAVWHSILSPEWRPKMRHLLVMPCSYDTTREAAQGWEANRVGKTSVKDNHVFLFRRLQMRSDSGLQGPCDTRTYS